MKNMNNQFLVLILLPALVMLGGCFEDTGRRMLFKNNGAPSQQDTRQSGHKNRTVTNPNTGFNTNQPTTPPPATGQDTTTSTTKKTTDDTAEQTTPQHQAVEMVTKAPMSARQVCNKIQSDADVSLKIWGNQQDSDRDGIMDQCEALIMGARYSNNLLGDTETQNALLDYSAIHAQRANGFLVGATYFPEDHFKKKSNWSTKRGFPLIGKKPENADARKDNRDANDHLGENEKVTEYKGVSIPPYAYEVMNHFFELKNPDERGDLPAYRRMFMGALTDGEKDVLINDQNLRKGDKFDRKYKQIAWHVVPEKSLKEILGQQDYQASTQGYDITDHVAVIRGGNADGIPFAVGSKNISLGHLSGIHKDTSTLRQNGSFMYVAETHLVVEEDIDLAIGHLATDVGNKMVMGSRSGTVLVLVNGQTELIVTDTIQNAGQRLESEYRTTIEASAVAGDCRSVHVVVVFIPNSEYFNSTFRGSVIADSLFYRHNTRQDEGWMPLHSGIASIFPVAQDNKKSCNVDQNQLFFNADYVQVFDKNKMEYQGDSFTYIHSPEIDQDAQELRITVEQYGKSHTTFTKDQVTIETNSGTLDIADIRNSDRSYEGIHISTITVDMNSIQKKGSESVVIKKVTIKTDHKTDQETEVAIEPDLMVKR